MKVNDGAGLESLAIDGKKGGLKDGGGRGDTGHRNKINNS